MGMQCLMSHSLFHLIFSHAPSLTASIPCLHSCLLQTGLWTRLLVTSQVILAVASFLLDQVLISRY